MSTVVDVHCHTFNADDLPVQGFVSRVAFHNVELARSLAGLVDRSRCSCATSCTTSAAYAPSM
jgi:hypothetical protein